MKYKVTSLSRYSTYALTIPLLACMLCILSCSQSARLATQNGNKTNKTLASVQASKSDTLTSVPITVPDIMPVFPDGDAGMMRYISENLKYPRIAQEQRMQGRVTLRFVIDKDGSIKNIEIIKGVDPVLDREAIRVIKSMPKWTPGRKNGVNVAVYYTLPILYKLNRP